MASNMLQELQTLALVGLLVSTYYLTVGCKNISESLPHESGHISGKVEGMTETLDDIADILNEALHAFAGNSSTQPAPDLMTTVLNSFMSGITSPKINGPQTERTVHEIDPQTTLETENELD
jgi:hypothetical protein